MRISLVLKGFQFKILPPLPIETDCAAAGSVLGCTSIYGLRHGSLHLSLSDDQRSLRAPQFVYPLTHSRENGTAIVLIQAVSPVSD